MQKLIDKVQSEPGTESEFMTTAEVSLERRVPQDTLRYWRMRNTGPVSFKIGRRVLYRRNEINEWFAAQEVATRRGGAAWHQP